jgi:hypothetical protein
VWRSQRVEAGSESDPAVGNIFFLKKIDFQNCVNRNRLTGLFDRLVGRFLFDDSFYRKF